MTSPRNPLTVPVAWTTIEEIEAQARHHATNAAHSTLEMFLKRTPENDATVELFGRSDVMFCVSTKGERMLDTVLVIHLDDLDKGESLVYFCTHIDAPEIGLIGGGSYGIVDVEGDIYQYDLPGVRLVTEVDTIHTAARVINDLKMQAGLATAAARIAHE